LADSVAKVGWMGLPRNVRSAARSALNLPCHARVTDESMLRASQPKILLQHYLPNADIIAMSMVFEMLPIFRCKPLS
jgi:hypothetical protein